MRPDLLSRQPFEGCAEGVTDGKTEQASADAVDAVQVEASWQGSFGFRVAQHQYGLLGTPSLRDARNVPTGSYQANRILPPSPTGRFPRRPCGNTGA